jgi:energy-coupling factor transport system permease protein
MIGYRRRASPLHSAGAASGCAYCLALAAAALAASSPILLGAVAVAVAAAGAGARVGAELRRAAMLAIPVAITIALINALVTRDGLTVIARLGDLPLVGPTDVTLEATVYGAMLGLRAAILIACGALYTAAVDPDQVLRLFRRVSFRSALTATLATRIVPVLMRDSRRLADAQRCRPGAPATRAALLRATTANVLDRALDVAAALEVRGYGAARRPARHRARRSRHQIGFMASAVAVVVVSVGSRVAGLAAFAAYPALRVSAGAGAWIVAGGLIVAAGVPFLDRRGLER